MSKGCPHTPGEAQGLVYGDKVIMVIFLRYEQQVLAKCAVWQTY